MKTLRQHIERAVRPIRASHPRKDRMREELLAHLDQLYTNELARCGDERTALAAAKKQFGEPGTLSRDLQATVPWIEKWSFASLPGSSFFERRHCESVTAHIWRVSRWQFAVSTTCFAVLCLFVLFITRNRPEVRSTYLLFYLLTGGLIQTTTLACFLFLCEGIRRNLHRRSIPAGRSSTNLRIVSYAALCSLLFAGSMAAIMGGAELAVGFPLLYVFGGIGIVIGLAAVLSLPLTALQVWQMETGTRRFEDWGSLDLSDELAD